MIVKQINSTRTKVHCIALNLLGWKKSKPTKAGSLSALKVTHTNHHKVPL